MLLKDERESVVHYGQLMLSSGLTKGTAGNLSAFNPDEKLLAIKPSGLRFDEIQLEDIVIMDLEGKVIEGNLKPSSEHFMHRIFYKNYTQVRGVVHTHSPYCTTFACLHWEIPPIHYLIASCGGKIPCAPYALYGTPELAKTAFETMSNFNAILLANHGLLAIGPSLKEAFSVAEQAEFVAELYFKSLVVGTPQLLSPEEMEEASKQFQTYGQRKKGGKN